MKTIPIERPTLSSLASQHGTDKGREGHGYTELYPTYFEPVRDGKLSVLEIGIRHGASLKMWEDYFPHAAIIGLDIDPECRKVIGGRRRVYIGSQTDSKILNYIANVYGSLDIILDDGSHRWAHQIKTFKLAFPLVRPGGFYIVEDLGRSFLWDLWYRKKFSLDVLSLRSPLRFFARLAMDVSKNGIEFIHFYKEAVVIKKV